MSDSIDKQAFHQFTYGLFLLTSRVAGRDNGCIVNTAIQSASEPRQVSVACIKGSCTQEMIDSIGLFCVSVLAESMPNAFFKHFGMQSGHDVEKFTQSASADILGGEPARSDFCGLVYEKTANAYFVCQVVAREDLGSHVLYTGKVVEAKRLSDEPSITYDYYRRVTKKQDAPAAQPKAAASSADTAKPAGTIVGWKCSICGYVYEGAELPPDFICPLCKHGAEDFEPIYG